MTVKSVSQAERAPLISGSLTTWNNKKISCIESFCGTCHTGAGCGFICSVISAIFGAIFLGLTIWSASQADNPTRTIVFGVLLAASAVGLLIGRCLVARYTSSIPIKSPYTGQVMEIISYPDTAESEKRARERGEQVGRRCASACKIL